MKQEMPAMNSVLYSASTVDPSSLTNIITTTSAGTVLDPEQPLDNMMYQTPDPSVRTFTSPKMPSNPSLEKLAKSLAKEIDMSNRRYVQVFLVDPDEKMPLNKAVLYKGEPELTDMSDDELFFSIPVMELLKTHNAERGTTKDEATSGSKAKCLKPIRIKDLSMTVVTIASF